MITNRHESKITSKCLTVAPSHENFVGKNILVVDRSRDIQSLILEILVELGASTVTAEDGRAAMIQIAKKKFDLILLNAETSTSEQHQTISDIRNSGLKLPIVALAETAFGKELKTLLSFGFNDVLAMPFERRNLMAILNSCLSSVVVQTATESSSCCSGSRV